MTLGAARRSPADIAFAAAIVAIAALHLALAARHAMWRDEMQAWMIAAASATPVDLYRAMRNEGHPGLWHALLWLAGFAWNDPRAMRALHLAIAASLLALIVARAPFTRIETLLLCAGYYVLFEYTVIARAYGLGFLLILLAVDAHSGADGRGAWRSWLLLGLAANTSVFGAIVASAFAAVFAWDARRMPRSALPGLALFATLAAFAAFWMWPAPDTRFGLPPSFAIGRSAAAAALRRFITAFAPLSPPSATAWEPDPLALVGILLNSNALAIAALAAAIAAAALCALARRPAQAGFAFATAALVGFINTYPILQSVRHLGAFFVAFVGFLWLARRRDGAPDRPAALPLACSIVLLALGAAGGLQVAERAWARPFSRGADVAAFLRDQRLDHGLIVGLSDATTSLVAGELGRPIYYPSCDCSGTFVRWNTQRRIGADPAPSSAAWPLILARLAAEPARAGVLLSGRPVDADAVQRAFPALAVAARGEFRDALVEQYFVYDIRLRAAP